MAEEYGFTDADEIGRGRITFHSDGRILFSIDSNGEVLIEPDATISESSRVFWDAISALRRQAIAAGIGAEHGCCHSPYPDHHG